MSVGGTQHMSLSAADFCLVVRQAVRALERAPAVRDDRFQRYRRGLTEIEMQQAKFGSFAKILSMFLLTGVSR